MVSRIITPESAGTAQAQPVPAPTLGLNTRDHFTNLQPNEARELVNWLPDVGVCKVRPGYEAWCDTATGAGHPVQTLVRYVSGSTQKLMAASNGSLFEVLSGTPSTLASGYTNNRWSTDFFNGYVFGVNGSDTPWRWQPGGAGLVATGFSGPTISQMRTIKSVQNRLWATVVNSGDVWYGGSMYVTGPFTVFQSSQIADGGYCMGVFPWRDTTCIVMSTGQVLVYQGDPATSFSLISKYYAPPLVEYDAAVKLGGELVLITTSGPISMDVISAGLAFNLEALGNWGKISPSWQADYKTYSSNSGWFGKFINGLLYFNIPNGLTPSKQYVFNTRNQGWTTYQDLAIASMEEVGSTIYFGSESDGNVYVHAGGLDGANQISTLARPGFSYFGSPGINKIYSRVKPNVFSAGLLSAQVAIDTDFTNTEISGATYDIGTHGGSTPWDSPWDSDWSDQPVSEPKWIGVAGKGRAASPVMRTYSTADDVQWYSTEVLGKPAGPI